MKVRKFVKKILPFINTHKTLIFIFVIGIFLRIYGSYQKLDYSHDQDLQAWFVRDVVNNNHIRLIGQETSTQGIFIGPLYYYLLVPFYLLFDMDPKGGLVLAFVQSIFSIWSYYFVFKKIYNKKTGLVAAYIYAISLATVSNDRSVLPTTPVFLWSVWYLYALYLLLSVKNKFSFALLAFLIGLTWNINVALILLFPLTLLSFYFSKKPVKENYKGIAIGVGVFLLTISPFIIFELRHNFPQIKYLLLSFTSNQGSKLDFYDQLIKVLTIVVQNCATLVINLPSHLYIAMFIGLIILFFWIIKNKLISLHLSIILISWLLFYIIFFSVYSKPVSEYYLNGITIVWILIITLGITKLLDKYKYFTITILSVCLVINISRFISNNYSNDGYIARRSIAAEIKRDSTERGFQCVSISYLTDTGYDRGFRYLYLLENLKLKPISNDVPVYSIVYPKKEMYQTHTTRGAIGIIYPDYSKYKIEKINETCLGEDFNLVEPMIGFTN